MNIDDIVRPLWAKVRNKPYLEDIRSKNANTVHYTDASGRVATVALGADGKVLTSTGLTTAPAWEGGAEMVWFDFADETVAADTAVNVTWDAPDIETTCTWWDVANPTRIVPPVLGWYRVSLIAQTSMTIPIATARQMVYQVKLSKDGTGSTDPRIAVVDIEQAAAASEHSIQRTDCITLMVDYASTGYYTVNIDTNSNPNNTGSVYFGMSLLMELVIAH